MVEDVHEGCKQESWSNIRHSGLLSDPHFSAPSQAAASLTPPPPWMSPSSLPVTFSIQFGASMSPQLQSRLLMMIICEEIK